MLKNTCPWRGPHGGGAHSGETHTPATFEQSRLGEVGLGLEQLQGMGKTMWRKGSMEERLSAKSMESSRSGEVTGMAVVTGLATGPSPSHEQDYEGLERVEQCKVLLHV